MPLRTEAEIDTSIRTSIQANSPQVRIDAAKGPFFYLASKAVAAPLSTASSDVERMALLSTNQFPSIATNAEALAVARSYGLSLGQGGFASGVAYFFTARRPLGTEQFIIPSGSTCSTAISRGQSFRVVEARALTADNADAFFNSSTRRFEVPVRVQALAAGTSGNVAARTLTVISGGAAGFEGVTNLVAFTGGSDAQTINTVYRRAQQRLVGLDNFSKGGLVNSILAVDPDRIEAVALTYSNEYPFLFYRLPDQPALDAWVLNTVDEVLVTETFVAGSAQTQFVLTNKPALSLSTCFVNGVSVTASLVLDTSLEVGRSTRENSYVQLVVPTVSGDIIDITYTYDGVLSAVQADIDGLMNGDSGSLFATDVLCRYPRSFDVAVTVTGTVLGTFDPTTVEEDVATVVGNYIANGASSDTPLLGGVRTAAELRDQIRSQVPGIASITIPIFGRKVMGTIVEALDIPRNAQIDFASSDDLIVTFT